ncbi:MAG: FAD:protein FMN transferase [bacterium]
MQKINLLILICLLLFSCTQKEKVYNYKNFLVGGPCEIKFVCSDKGVANRVLTEIDNELKRLDSLLNYFSPNSLISKINNEHRAEIPGDIKEIFLLSDSISRLTNGLFDISVAPLVEVWGFYTGEERIPEKSEIEKAKACVNYKKILLRGDSIFTPEAMKIDLGGIAQGFAADCVASILKKYRINSAIINIGGEVFALGNSPLKRPWTVGIKNPRGQGIIEKLSLSDRALSTSGDYEKFFVFKGVRYAHIINPKTGYPAENFASVTILDHNTAFADGIATAVSVMGAHQGKKFLDSLKIKGIIYYEKDNRLERLESE